MSLTARLHIQGHETEKKGIKVETCDYTFTQEIDAKGRPKSRVRGGVFKLTIMLEDDAELLAWMFNVDSYKSGKIIYMAGESKIQKTLEFQQAALVSYREEFADKLAVRVTIEISAESMWIGGAHFSNYWVGNTS